MSFLNSQCILFIAILLSEKSESIFIPVVAFKESSGLSPIISSVECTGLKLCNASLDCDHYLDSSDSCCGSTQNGTGTISKMRFLVVNSHGHVLWGAIFKIGQQNESWIITDHLVMTSDDRSIEAIDAISYDPIPQEFCFYADANKTLTTFSVVISKAVSYYILSRNTKGSPLPAGVEKNVSLLNDLSYQPLLGSFTRQINNQYIQVISDVPILVGRINLEILDYDDTVAGLNCEKQWELEYNIKSCDNQDTEFFMYNYTMNVNVICYGNVGMTIDVETIQVSCLRIYPEFGPDLDSSHYESLQFRLDILGPKGTSSFVRGSQLIMEEYWSSGEDTDEPGGLDLQSMDDSEANTSESETNPTFIDLASHYETIAVSEYINPIQSDTIVDQIMLDSTGTDITSTMSGVWSSESTENLVSEFQPTPLIGVSSGEMEILTENEVKMTSTTLTPSEDADTVSVDGSISLSSTSSLECDSETELYVSGVVNTVSSMTVNDLKEGSTALATFEDADTVVLGGSIALSSTLSFWQSSTMTPSLESDSNVILTEIALLMAPETELSDNGIVSTVSSMTVNNGEQESSKLVTRKKPCKHDKNKNSGEESVDDTLTSRDSSWIFTRNQNIFSIRTYSVEPEPNDATIDATTPSILEITKSLLHEASQVPGDVLYSSTLDHDTTTQNPQFNLEEMCRLINNLTHNVHLISEKCQEEIYITDSSGTPCQCQCRPKRILNQSLEQEHIQKKVEKIVRELTVDKKALSSTTRKLTSAPDPRKSSQTIGAIGIALLITVGALIVSLDIPHIIDLMVALKHKIHTSSLY